MHPGRARLALPPIALVALAELALATRAADPLLPPAPARDQSSRGKSSFTATA